MSGVANEKQRVLDRETKQANTCLSQGFKGFAAHHHQTERQPSNITGKPQRNVSGKPSNCLCLFDFLTVLFVSDSRGGDVP